MPCKILAYSQKLASMQPITSAESGSGKFDNHIYHHSSSFIQSRTPILQETEHRRKLLSNPHSRRSAGPSSKAEALAGARVAPARGEAPRTRRRGVCSVEIKSNILRCAFLKIRKRHIVDNYIILRSSTRKLKK